MRSSENREQDIRVSEVREPETRNNNMEKALQRSTKSAFASERDCLDCNSLGRQSVLRSESGQ